MYEVVKNENKELVREFIDMNRLIFHLGKEFQMARGESIQDRLKSMIVQRPLVR